MTTAGPSITRVLCSQPLMSDVGGNKLNPGTPAANLAIRGSYLDRSSDELHEVARRRLMPILIQFSRERNKAGAVRRKCFRAH